MAKIQDVVLLNCSFCESSEMQIKCIDCKIEPMACEHEQSFQELSTLSDYFLKKFIVTCAARTEYYLFQLLTD